MFNLTFKARLHKLGALGTGESLFREDKEKDIVSVRYQEFIHLT